MKPSTRFVWSFVAVFMALLVLLPSVSAAPQSSPPTCALGPATDFNLFIRNAITQSGSDTEGRVAAGGNINFSSYDVGLQLNSTWNGQNILIAGGNLTFNNGAVHRGNAVYGTTASVTNVTIDGVLQQGTPIDFNAAFTQLQASAISLAALPANGTTTVQYGGITLNGSNATQNVFTVNGSDLAVANTFTINAPAGSTVVVNINGTADQMANFGFFLNGVTRGKVLYNFYQATTLHLTGVGVEGSILAPNADVTFPSGVLQGTLVAKSLSGQGQLNHQPYTGCPSGSNTPTPGPTETPFPTNTPTPAPRNCTYTQGYWKNHPNAWPAQSLTIGNTSYTKTQLLTILNTAPGGDVTYSLSHQMIATKLNILNGANGTDAQSTITSSDTYIIAHPIGSSPTGGARQQGVVLANSLDQYNNGVSGPGHCTDEPVLGVTLASFDAVCQADGIKVLWDTASEQGTLGFNIRRSTDPDMVGTIINPELIYSQAPGGGQGASYEYLDAAVTTGTYYYWLEDVDLNGVSTLHGPINAVYPCTAPTAVTLSSVTSTPALPMPQDAGAVIALLGLAGAGVVLMRRK